MYESFLRWSASRFWNNGTEARKSWNFPHFPANSASKSGGGIDHIYLFETSKRASSCFFSPTFASAESEGDLESVATTAQFSTGLCERSVPWEFCVDSAWCCSDATWSYILSLLSVKSPLALSHSLLASALLASLSIRSCSSFTLFLSASSSCTLPKIESFRTFASCLNSLASGWWAPRLSKAENTGTACSVSSNLEREGQNGEQPSLLATVDIKAARHASRSVLQLMFEVASLLKSMAQAVSDVSRQASRIPAAVRRTCLSSFLSPTVCTNILKNFWSSRIAIEADPAIWAGKE